MKTHAVPTPEDLADGHRARRASLHHDLDGALSAAEMIAAGLADLLDHAFVLTDDLSAELRNIHAEAAVLTERIRQFRELVEVDDAEERMA